MTQMLSNAADAAYCLSFIFLVHIACEPEITIQYPISFMAWNAHYDGLDRLFLPYDLIEL